MFIGRLGLLRTGVVALVLQAGLLIAAGGVYARCLHVAAPGGGLVRAAAEFEGEGRSDLLELLQLGAGASGAQWMDAALAGEGDWDNFNDIL